MKTHTVTASRWERGWELDIEGVGVTQSHTLADADAMIRDYLALDLGGDPADYRYELRFDIGELHEQAEVFRDLSRQFNEAQDRLAAFARQTARDFRENGFTGADTAVVLGVSPQRVSQLLKS